MKQEQIDRLTQYLISNGDVPAVTSQKIYEYAWSQGIRPLRERDLKPETMVKRRKDRAAGRQPRHHGRGFSVLRAMKRERGTFELKDLIDEGEKVEEELGGWRA
jgi:hypothetical protein